MSGLRDLEWLTDLGEDEWSALRARATQRRFQPGATIFAPTLAPRSLYVLEEGRVRILRVSGDGDEVTLGYVLSGEVFGELPGFGDHPRESFAVARAPSRVWKIPLDLFQQLIAARPSIAVEITRQMGDRLKRAESRVESLVFGDVRSRLATALLELSEDFGRREGERWILDLELSQGELATLIGSTRQSVNGAMSQLREEGVLKIVAGRAELLDLEQLRRIVAARSR